MTGRPILTAAEMRAAEDAAIAAGSSVAALMDRAGAAVAEAARRYGSGQPVLVLCGPGNNGGDGYVAARRLAAAGVAVRVAASAAPRTGAATAARAGWDGPVEAIGPGMAPSPVLVDALFGTGLRRPLDAGLGRALRRLAAAAPFRLAVDLPSGLGSDDGACLGDVPPADLTLALGALKPAHRLLPGAALCGTVRVADIGIGVPDAPLREVARPWLPAPGVGDHKYSRGYVLVAGGAMAGAGLLAAGAALRGGAGYVALAAARAGTGGPHALVHRAAPDAEALAALLDDVRIGAVVAGPGLGLDGDGRARLHAALDGDRPLLLDADALTLLGPGGLPRLARRAVPALLTPHEGEFARLFGELPGSKLDRVRAAASRANAVVLLKGADSVAAAPDGRAVIAPLAPPWLASAGSGDVLAGIAAAQLARGLDPLHAAEAALWLHAEAARRAGPALIADDLLGALPGALAACA